MDIVIIGQQPWDTEIGSNCKNIALELSKTNRVLYINSPLDRITLIMHKNDPKIQKRVNVIRKKENGLVQIKDKLWNLYPDCMVESINWIKFSSAFKLLNRINNKKLASSIKKALKELNFEDFILFNDNEMFKAFYLKEYLKPKLSVYYSRDYMIGVDYWKKHGEKLEPELIAKSDLCFANSSYLANYCVKYNKKSFNVGQGCEVESFINVSQKPKELAKFSEKIIGYVGALNSERLAINVIEYIAKSFPNYKIVLVGPEDETFKKSNLHAIKNIIFLGQQNVDDLPSYINAFDVCINPQIVNAITIGNYPRKIDEYLAVGKPVVATRTETMEFFKNHVYLADTKEEYMLLIAKALIEDSITLQNERKQFASEHTWENSVQQMKNEIDNLLAAS